MIEWIKAYRQVKAKPKPAANPEPLNVTSLSCTKRVDNQREQDLLVRPVVLGEVSTGMLVSPKGLQMQQYHLLGDVVIRNAKQADNARPRTNNLPAKFIPRPLLVQTHTQSGAQNAHRDRISEEQGIARLLLRIPASPACLRLGLFLGGLGLCGGLFGFLLHLDALGLRLGLYGLRLEVGGNRRDVRRIDIDKGVHRVVGALDLWRGRGATTVAC